MKIQTYRPDTITLKSSNPEFQISSGSKGRTLYDLQGENLPWEWHAELFRFARKTTLSALRSTTPL